MDRLTESSTRLLSKTIIPFQVQWVVTALWLVVGIGKTNVDNLNYYHAFPGRGKYGKSKIIWCGCWKTISISFQLSILGVSFICYLFELLYFISGSIPRVQWPCPLLYNPLLAVSEGVSTLERLVWGEVMCNVMLYYCNIRWDQHLPSLVTTCF